MVAKSERSTIQEPASLSLIPRFRRASSGLHRWRLPVSSSAALLISWFKVHNML